VLRVSFGYNSRIEDVDQLILFLETFTNQFTPLLPSTISPTSINNQLSHLSSISSDQHHDEEYNMTKQEEEEEIRFHFLIFFFQLRFGNRIEEMFVYPIKSCQGVKIHQQWDFDHKGNER